MTQVQQMATDYILFIQLSQAPNLYHIMIHRHNSFPSSASRRLREPDHIHSLPTDGIGGYA